MDKLVLLFCSFMSCIIVINILFQFLNDRYTRTYRNKYLYFGLAAVSVISSMLVNMLMNPVLNLGWNIILFGVISYFFYYENYSKRFMCVLEAETLFAIAVMLEALGVYIIDLILILFDIKPDNLLIQKSIETVFSKLILLFLFYFIVGRAWKKGLTRTKTQYIMYSVMFIYSIVNFFIVMVILDKVNSIILIIIIGVTIFSNMYLLYFIKFYDERNYYKMQVGMMEQQEKIQYDNYQMQLGKYNDVMVILHDVDKHIKIIEGLYQSDLRKEALDYTKQINDILRPLVPFQYSNNSVLNCLLSEKEKVMDSLHITHNIEVNQADINFMRPIDITTLFGNLFDNAIAANRKEKDGKYIGIYVREYNEMISIRVENSIFDPVIVKNGQIQIGKREKRAIGTLNIQRCVDAYDGSIVYKDLDHMLVCNIILNRINLS